MKDFVSFITENYHVLVVLSVQLVTFVILLCKKKVKIDDIFKQVLLVLPDFINIAEMKFENGADKYSYVFNRCLDLLQVLTKKSGQEVCSEYTALIDSAIEHNQQHKPRRKYQNIEYKQRLYPKLYPRI